LNQVDIGILDFSKAFDKVDHSRLLQKLGFYGVRGKPLLWIQSFLSDITQQVVVEGSFSTPHQESVKAQFFGFYIHKYTKKIRNFQVK